MTGTKLIQRRNELWQLLAGLAGNIAEVGVAEGRFSAEMLDWPIEFDYLFMVDRWRTVEEQLGDASQPQEWHSENYIKAKKAVARHGLRAVFMRGDSVERSQCIIDGSLKLVYIDADHSYEGVKRDIEAWVPKLVPGGVLAFHDYANPDYGVNRAVQEFASATNLVVHDIPEESVYDAGAFIIC